MWSTLVVTVIGAPTPMDDGESLDRLKALPGARTLDPGSFPLLLNRSNEDACLSFDGDSPNCAWPICLGVFQCCWSRLDSGVLLVYQVNNNNLIYNFGHRTTPLKRALTVCHLCPPSCEAECNAFSVSSDGARLFRVSGSRNNDPFNAVACRSF